MNQQQVAFLRRLIETEPPFRPYSATAEYLLNAEGIGKVQGRRVVYTQRDFAAARNLLKVRSFEISRQVEPVPRSQVQPGESEKWGSLRVSEDLVAVVPLGLTGVQIPMGSMLCMDVRQALASPYEVLVFCENLEPMLRLHECKRPAIPSGIDASDVRASCPRNRPWTHVHQQPTPPARPRPPLLQPRVQSPTGCRLPHSRHVGRKRPAIPS